MNCVHLSWGSSRSDLRSKVSDFQRSLWDFERNAESKLRRLSRSHLKYCCKLDLTWGGERWRVFSSFSSLRPPLLWMELEETLRFRRRPLHWTRRIEFEKKDVWHICLTSAPMARYNSKSSVNGISEPITCYAAFRSFPYSVFFSSPPKMWCATGPEADIGDQKVTLAIASQNVSGGSPLLGSFLSTSRMKPCLVRSDWIPWMRTIEINTISFPVRVFKLMVSVVNLEAAFWSLGARFDCRRFSLVVHRPKVRLHRTSLI